MSRKPKVTFHNPADVRRDLNREAAKRVRRDIDPSDLLKRRPLEVIREELREAARIAEVFGSATGHIDHMPGADWHGFERISEDGIRGYWQEREAPVSAPAPSHAVSLWYVRMARTDLASVRTGVTSDWMSAEDVLTTVRAGVRRLMSGRGYWDQEDAISYAVSRILNTGRRTGSARDVLRYIDRAERFPVTTTERHSVNPRSVTPLAISRLVADWSRREARNREALESAAQETGAAMSLADARVTSADGSVVDGAAIPAPALAPHAASSATDQLTDALGVGRIGGVWEALYVLIRDITTEDAAQELETTHAALRAKTSRGARWLRENLPTPAHLRSALDWYTDPTTRERKMPARPLREGTNGGAPAIRPKDADHARALCAKVTLPTTDASTTHADRVHALLTA